MPSLDELSVGKKARGGCAGQGDLTLRLGAASVRPSVCPSVCWPFALVPPPHLQSLSPFSNPHPEPSESYFLFSFYLCSDWLARFCFPKPSPGALVSMHVHVCPHGNSLSGPSPPESLVPPSGKGQRDKALDRASIKSLNWSQRELAN